MDNAADENLQAGYHIGAYYNFRVSDVFAIQPEVLFSTKGSEADYTYDLGSFCNIEGNAQIKLDYIDIPVIAVFRIGDGFEFNLGPYFGFLVNTKYKFEGTVEANGSLDSDSFKNMDYGLVGGFTINISALQIGARYNYGLQKIQDSSFAKTLLGNAKNSYFQIFVAIRIGNYN